MSPDSAQALAHLSDPALLAAYVNWRIAKADQVVGSSGAMILKLAKAVCNAEHGYLRARPDIGRRVDVSDPTAWAQRCDNAIAFINGVLHDREATVRKHYGHLQNGDGARWLDQALGNTFRRM